MRVLSMNSKRTQMRFGINCLSTVAIKLAKGPVDISTLSPSFRLLGGSSIPDSSHLIIRPEIN